MIIGFIGFGRVSSRLAQILSNYECITSCENRSTKTKELIKNSNVKVLKTNKEVAKKSDVLISANSTKNALKVASDYGKYCNGIYLDLNNISPETSQEISLYVTNYVKGAIIGKIEREKPILYLSGEKASNLLFLKEYLDIYFTEDASILKLIRSIYTKSVSASLIESIAIAEKYNLKNDFLKVLSLTEGNNFKSSSISRINNTIKNKDRKIEEIEEIIDYLEDDDLIILNVVLEKFKDL